MALGQTAAPLGRGATEVGVFGGVMYASQTSPGFESTTAGDPTTTSTQGRAFGAPLAEANIQHGFDDHVALNVHASSAGLQPGLKWTLNKSKVAHVALLPAVGLGYGSYGQTTSVSGADGVLMEGSPSTTTSFTFLAGLKFLVSHRSGFFAGVGYDFLLNRSLNTVDRGTANSGDRSAMLTLTTMHQISASVGFELAFGMVRIKPEVAFAAYPGIATTITNQINTAADPVRGRGGFGWAIFPGFTVSVVSPQRELTEEEREELKAKARHRRKSDGDPGDDDEDDDESEAPRPKAHDDDEAPRKPRDPRNDDDLRD